MDRNRRIARAINMRQTPPIPHVRTAEPAPGTVYFIESRPHPGAPWERASTQTATWEEKSEALRQLAARREMQPNWEHRLMERITTVTEQHATEA
jgi:hypothetical protein